MSLLYYFGTDEFIFTVFITFSIDSIGGGNILRALDSIGGGNILRGRQIDSIGGGNILRDTDKFRYTVLII